MTQQQIPDGYMQNSTGSFVPLAQVREQDKLRDQVARNLSQRAIELNGLLRQFKRDALDDISDLVQIAADRYDVRLGGKKGNITAMSYDGQYKVIRSYAERVTHTEEIEVAKELISACLKRWSEGANANIQVIVERAFRTNNQGQLKMGAILDLLRVEIDDDEWNTAMEALKDSLVSSGTAVYIRIYQRVDDTDNYKAIPLDLASV